VRKAYRITGSSFTEPINLPEGFTVKERLVGEVLGTKALVFHEVKDGSVVVYRQGVAGSNVKLSPEEVGEVAKFLVRVFTDTGARKVAESYSKCPGTPHRGHSASDWSCPYDRA
jgi:hypothetical protein